ncbi:MAG: hypothetical protein E6J62_00300 [Deltaproteobacteria bacterium]|nr:MAG: hypothetical protein E6J62_00300 [Deltaproteobacteria bacterium]
MRRVFLLFSTAALVAACGPAAVPARAQVPGLDRLSGEIAPIDVELPGVDLASVRGPAGWVVVGATFDSGRVLGGSSPECALRRTLSGAVAAQSPRCASFLGAYASLERARQFLLAAGAEALPAAPLVVDSSDAAPGLRYVPEADAYTLAQGPSGARVPAALNPGAVVREAALRQLHALAAARPDDAEAVATFLGAAAASDPGYLAASEVGGDPTGQLDLSRPLLPGSSQSAVLAGALWAWADALGDPAYAAKAALSAARAVTQRSERGGPAALLSLVAGQLDGAERDQACAVFRARLSSGEIEACP